MLNMSFLGGKRIETLPVKFSANEKKAIEKIGKEKDRPKGYVIRELMLRGLVQYWLDGELRVNQQTLETLAENKYEQTKPIGDAVIIGRAEFPALEEVKNKSNKKKSG